MGYDYNYSLVYRTLKQQNHDSIEGEASYCVLHQTSYIAVDWYVWNPLPTCHGIDSLLCAYTVSQLFIVILLQINVTVFYFAIIIVLMNNGALWFSILTNNKLKNALSLDFLKREQYRVQYQKFAIYAHRHLGRDRWRQLNRNQFG